VPTDLQDGTDYKVKIMNASNSNVYDYSDPFKIETKRTITVTEPTSSTIWRKGENGTIQWSWTGSISIVNIYLYKGTTKVKDIALNTANDGTHTWLVPTDLQDGTDYKVKIVEASDSNVYGDSSGFTICQKPSPPTSLTPYGGQLVNNPVVLNWTPVSNATSYIVRVFNNENCSGTPIIDQQNIPNPPITVSIDSAGTYSWQVIAVNACGPSDPSQCCTFQIGPPPPISLNPPTLTSPPNGGSVSGTTVTLQWQDTNDNPQEQGYVIRMKREGEDYGWDYLPQNTTSITYNLLDNYNTKYYWNVRALGDGVNTSDSDWANSGTDWTFITGNVPPHIFVH
jgi:hypothetical protein